MNRNRQRPSCLRGMSRGPVSWIWFSKELNKASDSSAAFPPAPTHSSLNTTSLSTLVGQDEEGTVEFHVGKAAHPDGISSKELTTCADQMLNIVWHIFSLSLRLKKVYLRGRHPGLYQFQKLHTSYHCKWKRYSSFIKSTQHSDTFQLMKGEGQARQRTGKISFLSEVAIRLLFINKVFYTLIAVNKWTSITMVLTTK